jgi:hypothetical protein
MTDDGPLVLPCGCRFDADVIDGVRTLILTACPAGERCQYVRYTFEQAAAQGKPATVLDARD